jgi:hypothetical protein
MSKYNPDHLSQIHLWVNNHFNVTAKYNLHLQFQCQNTFETTLK